MMGADAAAFLMGPEVERELDLIEGAEADMSEGPPPYNHPPAAEVVAVMPPPAWLRQAPASEDVPAPPRQWLAERQAEVPAAARRRTRSRRNPAAEPSTSSRGLVGNVSVHAI